MHILKFDKDYTRRHFLETMGKGVVTAGVLAPLWDVVAATGDSAGAYPDEALSIEHYSKGAVKAGGVLDADNVDSVKELVDPVAYRQIKTDGRVVDIIPTPTDIMHLNPAPYIEATLRNKGKAKFDERGNVVNEDGGPWIGGHPFPEAENAKEMMAGVAMSWGRHDVGLYCTKELDRSPEGKKLYEYESVFAEVQATGRLVLDPKPHMPGHEDKLRYNTLLLTSPTNVSGTSFYGIWWYDQSRFPDVYGYIRQYKRVRSLPTNQRFEPVAAGSAYYTTDAWTMGDPFLTWGNFRGIGKMPFLGGVVGQGGGWYHDDPNWEAPLVGGKTGEKYLRMAFSLVPETYVIEMEPVKYPKAPYSKRRVWLDARTLTPMLSLAYNKRGEVIKQFEFGTALFEKPTGEKFAVGGETYWSWTQLHIHSVPDDRLSAVMQVRKNNKGYLSTFNDPTVYEDFCTRQAIHRLGV
jgi:hypothetical protein